MSKRFTDLLKSVLDLVVKEDAFGLTRMSINPLTGNQRFANLSDQQKLITFQEWMKAQVKDKIVRTAIDEIDNAWWQEFVQQGFEKGAGRAFTDTRRAQTAAASSQEEIAFLAGTKEEFLRRVFGSPVSVEKVQLLVTRVMTELQGVSDNMVQRAVRELADGFAQGKGVRDIARELSRAIKISRNSAKRIARDEVIRAHAEGQLQALKDLGVAEVGVLAEWSTAEDARVCPRCRPLDGVLLKIEEAEGTIPRHPNCRCAFVPAFIDIPEPDQKRTKSAIEKAVRQSVKAEIPKKTKRTIAQQRRVSKWAGSRKKITKRKRVTSR